MLFLQMSSSLHAKFTFSIAYLAKRARTDLSIKERHLPTDFVLIMKMHSGQGHPDVWWQLEFKSFFACYFQLQTVGNPQCITRDCFHRPISILVITAKKGHGHSSSTANAFFPPSLSVKVVDGTGEGGWGA